MILKALKDLADREGLLVNPNYEPKPVAYLIVIDENGRCLKIRDTFTVDGTGKGKPKAKSFMVPRPFPGARRSGVDIDPGFLVDNASFILGLNVCSIKFDNMTETLHRNLVKMPDIKYDEGTKKIIFGGMLADQQIFELRELTNDKKWGKVVTEISKANKYSQSELEKRKTAFAELIQAAEEKTKDVGLKAVRLFLESILEPDNDIDIPIDITANALFGFIYEPDIDQLVHQRPAVIEYWGQYRAQTGKQIANDQSRFNCLVTGAPCIPVDKHPLIKVPGGTPSGVALVTFNDNAFESYGLIRNENAPVSRSSAEAYTTALRRLLDWSYPNPVDGSPLPKRNVKLSNDTIVVFWSREESEFLDFFSDAVEANPEAVEAVYESAWKGRHVPLDNPTAFYALTLSGAQGRATIRGWFESTVKDVAANVKQHFEDLKIVYPGNADGQLSSLRRLLRSTVSSKVDNPDKQIHPNLAKDMFEVIVKGYPYPRIILDAVIRRICAEQGNERQNVTPERAALIKAFLVRGKRFNQIPNNIPEVKIMLDKECNSTAYRLGRLFAVLERLQQKAIGASTTIRNRYYGAASATPVVVFAQLLRKAPHHLAKRDDAPFYEKLIQEILSPLPPENAFPSTLTLEEQGVFALGYYHQRQDLFSSSSKKTEQEG